MPSFFKLLCLNYNVLLQFSFFNIFSTMKGFWCAILVVLLVDLHFLALVTSGIQKHGDDEEGCVLETMIFHFHIRNMTTVILTTTTHQPKYKAKAFKLSLNSLVWVCLQCTLNWVRVNVCEINTWSLILCQKKYEAIISSVQFCALNLCHVCEWAQDKY